MAECTKYGTIWPILIKSDQIWSIISSDERFSPYQGRIEKPRSNISGYGMFDTLRQDCTNLRSSGI